ncbi:MAG: GGDEF domain-containing protein [Fibrobacter sp.]|nr:GGDEF domain-containing protein [Fibrobacter sp.]
MSETVKSNTYKVFYYIVFAVLITWQLWAASAGAATVSAPSDMSLWLSFASSLLVFVWIIVLAFTPVTFIVFLALFLGFSGLFSVCTIDLLSFYREISPKILSYQEVQKIFALGFISVGVISWSIDRRKEHKASKTLIAIDSLTGLYNTRFFYQELENEIRRVRRYQRELALLLVRVEGLREYNELYGYSEGDKVLKDMGQSILGYLRRSDIGCRFGASEFAVLLPETPSAGAALVAQRLQNRLQSLKFMVDGKELYQKISISIVQLQEDETSMGLVRRGEKLLEVAMEQGGNMIIKK